MKLHKFNNIFVYILCSLGSSSVLLVYVLYALVMNDTLSASADFFRVTQKNNSKKSIERDKSSARDLRFDTRVTRFTFYAAISKSLE